MLLLLFPRITRSFRSLLIDSAFGCSFIRLLSLALAFLSSGDQLTLGNNLRLECAFTVRPVSGSKLPPLMLLTVFLLLPLRRFETPGAFSSSRWFSSSPSSIDSSRCFISGAKTPSVPPAFLPAYNPSIASCLMRSKSKGVFSFINMSLDISNLTIYSFYPVTQFRLHSPIR